MLTKSYRAVAAASAAGAATGASGGFNSPPGVTLTLQFEVPPTINVMLDMAKDRRRMGRGDDSRMVPRYWLHQQEYKDLAYLQLLAQGHRPGVVPWAHWTITAIELVTPMPWDPIERQAACKWPVDLLVNKRYVVNDSWKHLDIECLPTQRVTKAGPHFLTITMRRDA